MRCELDVGAAAAALWSRWTTDDRPAGFPAPCRPATEHEGWRIQRALDSLAGPRAGWKIAATSAAGQADLGVSAPLIGPIYERGLRQTGSRIDAPTMRSAEPEFAFRIGHDLRAGQSRLGREEVIASVEAVLPAIEIPDSRFLDFTAVGVPQLLADAVCAAYVVVGSPRAAFDPSALASQRVVMFRNGAVVSEGSGAAVLGDPWVALTWLANELADRGYPLVAGDVVITGTCAPPIPIAPGDELFAHFGAFGSVAVSFNEPPTQERAL